MILNAEQILKFVKLNGEGTLAQVGIDLTVDNITEITGGYLGKDFKDIQEYKKTYCPHGNVWYLGPGVYSITFHQSIKLDSKHSAFIQSKSTLQRMGGVVGNSVFDPGFECENIGCTLFLFNNIQIEKGASIAQILVHENTEAYLYNGNYQGKKDKK